MKVLELDTNKPNLKFIKNRKIIRNFFGPKTLTQLTPETEIPSILNLNTSAEKVNYFLKVNERHFIPKNTTYQSTGQLRGAFIQSTQYEQIYRGLPVFGAKIVISQRKTDHVITSAINSFDLDLPVAMETEEGRITAQQVIEIAHKLFDAKFGVIKLGVPKLYIYRHLPARMVKPLTPSETLKKITEQSTGQTNSIYVAWRLAMDTQEPHSNWELLINAVNGNLITARDRASYNTRKGKVFWPDPIRRKKDSTLYWPNNSAKDKVMRKTLVEQTVEKEIGNLNPPNSNKQYSLTGKWVDCVNIHECPREDITPPKTKTHFRYKPPNPKFLDVMAYFYLDTLITYLQALGIEEYNKAVDDNGASKPIHIDSHGMYGDDNSAFFPNCIDEPFISFGNDTMIGAEGGVPDASDPGIIVHEYGHAIHFFLFGDRGQDIYEEGFCDFLAACWLDRFNEGLFNREYVFPWNQYRLKLEDRRRVNRTEKFGSVRYDGSYSSLYQIGDIHASTLWDIYQSMGGSSLQPEVRNKAADNIISIYLEMLTTILQDPTIEEITQGLMQADENRGGNNVEKIKKAFENRGIQIP